MGALSAKTPVTILKKTGLQLAMWMVGAGVLMPLRRLNKDTMAMTPDRAGFPTTAEIRATTAALSAASSAPERDRAAGVMGAMSAGSDSAKRYLS